MRRIYQLLAPIGIIIFTSLIANGQSIERFVFGSFGESVNNSGITFTYAVGEPITPTYFSLPNNLILTQGFLQPEKTDISFVESYTSQMGDFSIFPNPCIGSFFIQTDTDKTFGFQLHNTDGKLLIDSKSFQKFFQNQAIVNIGNLAPAIYYLRILDPKNQLISNFKLIKIN